MRKFSFSILASNFVKTEGDLPFVSRLAAASMGIRIGDAMGWIAETGTPLQIREMMEGKKIAGFLDSRDVKPISPKWYGGFKAGDYTDDTQQMFAILRSLGRLGCFDLEDIAREHLIEHSISSAGWGRTTEEAMTAFIYYYAAKASKDPNGPVVQAARHPLFPIRSNELGKGCGNGVAMKIAPLAMFYATKAYHDPVYRELYLELMLDDTIKLGRMTHPDIRASIAAYAVAYVIFNLLLSPRTSPDSMEDFCEELIDRVRYAESIFKDENAQIDPVSKRLELVRDNLNNGQCHKIAKFIGTECYALKSVPFAIWLAFMNLNYFKAGIIDAVNAGGDTDTIAAMVGAMIGANVGINGIPKDWLTFRSDFFEPMRLTLELYRTLTR